MERNWNPLRRNTKTRASKFVVKDRSWRIAPLEQLEDRLAPATLVQSIFPDAAAPQLGGRFGNATAADSSFHVVGAPSTDVGGVQDCGAAYVFDANTGALVTVLANPTPASGDFFGTSVSVSGNIVVVGAYEDDTGATGSGQAYVFNATTGALIVTLTNPSPANGDQFGAAVSISGNTVVVGTPGESTDASSSGRAYTFNATTGALIATLINPSPAVDDVFGAAVAISGNTVVVGAFLDDQVFSQAGMAYLFDATTGTKIADLNNPANTGGDLFGRSVAIAGNLAVVGSVYDDAGAVDGGQAYVYNATTGVLVSTLVNPTPAFGDNFGASVAISGNSVVVGNLGDDAGGAESGQAYVFNATTGAPIATIANPTPAQDDYFGNAVAISGNNVIVGSQDDIRATDSGQAYVHNATTGALIRTLAQPFSTPGTNYGGAVAVSGNTMVVGAPLDDSDGTNSGRAFLYNATTGVLIATLANPTPASGDSFGNAVAISGNIVVVAAHTDSAVATSSGQAYLFNATTGAYIATLANPSPAANDFFGGSVAISGNTVVVGAWQDDADGNNNGRAYLFNVASPGTPFATLNNPKSNADDLFGASVAISGNTVVVGAFADDTGAPDSGEAYLFDATTGAYLRTLANPTIAADDRFGISVAISGNIVVVGAYLDSGTGIQSGQAYLFNADTGAPFATLPNPFPANYDLFGASVAISGNRVVVSAYTDNTVGNFSDSGEAYLFNANTGTFIATLANPTPGDFDYFGASVGISGSTIIVGSHTDDTLATDQGAAYVFIDPTTVVSQSGGNVTIDDVAGVNDALTGSVVNVAGLDYLRVNDAVNFLTAGAGAIQIDANTVHVLLSTITGSIAVNSGGGNDTFTVNISGGNPIPSGGITFNGGAGGLDTLVLQGGTVTSQTFSFTNSTDGSVVLSGLGTITYTGLDPISSTINSSDVILNYSTSSETITVQQYGAHAARTQVTSAAAESVDFLNPTNSLQIFAGDLGNDTVTVNGFGTSGGGFTASLIIDGGSGNDTINLNADINFASGKNLDVDLQDDDAVPDVDLIDIGANANLILSGVGVASLKASQSISFATGSSIVVVNGDLTFPPSPAMGAIRRLHSVWPKTPRQ